MIRTIDLCLFNKLSSGLKTDTLDVKGSFTIRNEGSITARAINAEGSVSVNQLIKAETIDSFGFIYADTIIAKNIYIRSKNTRVARMLKSEGVDVTLPLVIGDYIELINVKAHEVRGKHIKIGPNCRIDRVEYHKTLEVDPTSRVDETEQVQ